MLILTRKVGETICIGKDIRIMVLDASHDKARVGVEAPRDVAVDREEIYIRKQQEKLQKYSESSEPPIKARASL